MYIGNFVYLLVTLNIFHSSSLGTNGLRRKVNWRAYNEFIIYISSRNSGIGKEWVNDIYIYIIII